MHMWMDSTIDSRKGDVLTLPALCVFVEKHAVVHLKNNKIWTSLKNNPPNHNTALNQVNLHLVYLGWGIFAKLNLRVTLLQVESPPGVTVTTVVVSTMQGSLLDLSPEESKMLDKLIFSGIDVGLDQKHTGQVSSTAVKPASPTVVKQPIKQELDLMPIDTCSATNQLKTAPRTDTTVTVQGITAELPVNISAVIDRTGNIQVEEAHSSKMAEAVPIAEHNSPAHAPDTADANTSQKEQSSSPSLAVRDISLKLVKLAIEPGKRILITQDILDSIPSSKYSDETWKAVAGSKETPPSCDNTGYDSDTVAYPDSDETMIYWNNTDVKAPKRKMNKRCRKPIKRELTPKPTKRLI